MALSVNRTILLIVLLLLTSSNTFSQQWETPETGTANSDTALTLTDCLKYALKHQPAVNQAYIDEAIAHTNNLIAFSGWMPQVTGAANYIHYFQSAPTLTNVNNNLTLVQGGAFNISTPSVSANQTLFNTDVLLAVKGARLNTLAAQQRTAGAKIDLVTNVSKAFYDLLLSISQVGVYKEDTARLRKNQMDAYNRYVSGISDKVDYKQATISLNNTLSQLKSATEAVNAKSALLRQYMGFPSGRTMTVHFDTVQMLKDIAMDTSAQLDFERRIEYQELQTARRIQRETTSYYQLGFLPSLSGFYTYNYGFESNNFSDLYSHAYPYSLFGLQLSIPIFTGLKRLENVHRSKLQELRIDWDDVNLRLAIYTQYNQALAGYKSNLYYLHKQRDNMQMAREVYNIVQLQYREGIKAYIDVIVAESDLVTSEVNYLNALFQLLQSKIDLEKAMGDIPTDI
jgi:outer membrane protein TolC